MWNNTKVIDVHGHMSTPAEFRGYAANIVAQNYPAKLSIPDDQLEGALKRHLGVMDERNIDLQLIGPRPIAMWHWLRPFLQDDWCKVTNNVIAQSVKLHPDRFVGMAQLPQSPYLKDTKNCAEELERCVKELGFVGGYLNPDPGGKKEVPGVDNEFWFPLYEKAQSLGAVIMIHPSASYDPRIEAIAANYQVNNVTEEYIAMMLYQHSHVLDTFKNLKIVICHCGGSLQRFIPSDHHNGHRYDNNIFFDTCALDVDFLTAAFKQKGVDQMLFGTEAPGSGGAVRPETGRPGDDLVPVIDTMVPGLTNEDKVKVFNTNPKRVFKLLKA